MAKKEETLFQEKVEKFLTSQGAFWFKYWGGGIYNRSGMPDLMGCINGHFLALELKTPIGKASELQKYNIDKIRKAGGIGLFLRPEDFEEFKLKIENLTRSDCNE
ncbi:MAG: VRR-NUC domain-containing protein [Hominimerdicola sp.]